MQICNLSIKWEHFIFVPSSFASKSPSDPPYVIATKICHGLGGFQYIMRLHTATPPHPQRMRHV